MFFINTTDTYLKRFDMGKFMNYENSTYDVLNSYLILKLQGLNESGNFTVSVEEERVDLISFLIYGDTQYWWILMFYNSIIEPSDVIAGLVLKFPSLSAIEDLFFSLKSLETASLSPIITTPTVTAIASTSKSYYAWQTIIANYTAKAGDGLFVSTDVTTILVTLPLNPNIGDEVAVVDRDGNADINNITIGRNGKNIMGLAEDTIIKEKNRAVIFIYSGDATEGWRARQ